MARGILLWLDLCGCGVAQRNFGGAGRFLMMKPLIFSALVTLSLCAMAQTANTPVADAKPDPNALPAGPGRDLVQKDCVACHSIRNVTGMRATKDEWNATLNKMIENGANIPDEDADVILQYLSKNFGPPSAGSTTGDQGSPTGNSH